MGQARRMFREGENYYVPAMQAAADLGQGLRGRISLGTPIAADADLILAAQSIATAVDTRTFAAGFEATEEQMGRFGRILTLVASGASTATVVVYGRDYLGQRMVEQFTLNGTTPIAGKKAFRHVDRITSTVTAATTINVGVGGSLGMPYAFLQITDEYSDGLSQDQPTYVTPSYVDPQTAITNDPRGLVIPNSTLNGTKEIELECQFTSRVNAAGNGGLHGLEHYHG